MRGWYAFNGIVQEDFELHQRRNSYAGPRDARTRKLIFVHGQDISLVQALRDNRRSGKDQRLTSWPPISATEETRNAQQGHLLSYFSSVLWFRKWIPYDIDFDFDPVSKHTVIDRILGVAIYSLDYFFPECPNRNKYKAEKLSKECPNGLNFWLNFQYFTSPQDWVTNNEREINVE